jgi:hypothetical protein
MARFWNIPCDVHDVVNCQESFCQRCYEADERVRPHRRQKIEDTEAIRSKIDRWFDE